LGAAQGTKLSLRAEGADADRALQSIVELFDSRFEDPKAINNAETGG
jgi:phosphotransferase system HPr-like phosphotransfer protein